MTPLETHFYRALQRIAEPYATLKDTVKALGGILDEQFAQSLINDPQHYQLLAQVALSEAEALKPTLAPGSHTHTCPECGSPWTHRESCTEETTDICAPCEVALIDIRYELHKPRQIHLVNPQEA